eukprot:TRINITY_DN2562_c4_g1_i1.p1 TRINITY_DN2562_c4_g1~~TRINITY_DN2562_c4_g1_i1.p1  ORF type:complete len:236 (-),score=73.87 TRINITY_DN2562_c4_g1_i1:22-729(-)
MTTVGYGDLSASSHCGRLFSVVTAILGILVTSLSIVVISNKLSLGSDELRVVNMLEKDEFRSEFRELAVRLIQKAFRASTIGKKKASRKALFVLVTQFKQAKRKLYQSIQTYNQSLAPNRLDELFFRNQKMESRLDRVGQASVLLQKRVAQELQRVNRRIGKVMNHLDHHEDDTNATTDYPAAIKGNASNDAVDQVLKDSNVDDKGDISEIKNRLNELLHLVTVFETRHQHQNEK